MAYLRVSFTLFIVLIASISVESRSTDDQNCGSNEEFSNCGTQCERTCADINTSQKLCNHMCAIGCFCTNGYIRQSDSNGACIKETNVDTLPRSDTANYKSMNSPILSSVATNEEVHKNSPLYTIGDRAQYHTDHLEPFHFLPFAFYDVSQIKASSIKMTRACVPSIPNNHVNNDGIDISSVTLQNSMSFYKLIEES